MGHDCLPFMPVFKTWDGNILDYSQYSFRIFSKLVSTLFLKLFPPLLNSHPLTLILAKNVNVLTRKDHVQ
jgi:hypothetical protein